MNDIIEDAEPRRLVIIMRIMIIIIIIIIMITILLIIIRRRRSMYLYDYPGVRPQRARRRVHGAQSRFGCTFT